MFRKILTQVQSWASAFALQNRTDKMNHEVNPQAEYYQSFPENGSVVIIDDQPNEALPIVRALSKRGISTTYYMGNVKEDLPIAPVQVVRLLFLDLQIIETSNENQIAKSIVNVLLKIIPKNNGPYLLVIWSKKYNTYSESVKQEIFQHEHLIPACIVNIDKAACLQSNQILAIDPDPFLEKLNELLIGQIDDQDLEVINNSVLSILNREFRFEFDAKADAVDRIETQLKEELEKAGSFHLFVIWENIVKKSAANMVHDISSLINKDEYWDINARNILKRMGVARVGQNQVGEDVLIRESINTLNISLTDNIENEIKSVRIPEYIKLEHEALYIHKAGPDAFLLKNPGTDLEIYRGQISLKRAGKDKLRKSILTDNNIIEADRSACVNLIDKYHLLPSSLNTKLHIELKPSQDLMPGNIYINTETKKKRQYVHSFLKNVSENLDEYFLIDLEVSPICDYAQDKWKRSRTLPGLMYPAKYSQEKRSGANLYPVIPSFDIDKIEYNFIFDYHLFHAWDKANAKKRVVKYRVKRELLLDIIAQLSSHVNRPGISFIE